MPLCHERVRSVRQVVAQVLIDKPLAQGLLTGTHDPAALRVFGDGDHRRRKRWFTPAALAILTDGLDELRRHVGDGTGELVRIALWSCLDRYAHAAVLVGFTTPEQIEMNLTCLGEPPTSTELATAREIMGRVQAKLDAGGKVFTDEQPTEAQS